MDQEIIVAMKGHPCTGKSTLAELIADELKCTPIKLDDVRSCITMLQQQQPLGDAQESLNNLSFEIICQTALIQLRSGLSVVLDSPLLHRAHLDRLLELSTTTKLPLVIVECIPRDRVQWKLRLEKQQQQQEEVVNGGGGGGDGATCCWYRPSTTWDDLQRQLNTFIDYEVGEGEIRKLTVDTTSHFKPKVSHAVSRLSLCKLSHCVDLTQWVRDGFDGLEGEEDWKENKVSKQEEEQRRTNHVHRLTTISNINEETINNKGVTSCCRKCQQEIITGEEGPCPTTYYKCANCDVVLHKSCAETPNKEELKPFHCLPFRDPSSLEYSFPEKYSCHFHSDADNGGFSYDCPECLFESHLRCALLPSVLYFHELHHGPLFFAIFPARHDMTFYCQACGHEGKDAFYMCNDCPLIMHVNCALLPPTLKYQRHQHTLTLTCPPQLDDSEMEYICDTCENGRDPNRWVYECLECGVYTSHLNCVAPVKLNLP
ncbi:hypothetical protein LOK49_LG08G03400 [Camellia lanceoleosa]|uniref:Uncharacterized protein n=1 Tax=Camellia lanceoleosa TaxID=1840588 RepID=A0ACC0GQX9_9ERIC|nr:hypothetical protein LOK49_LG08G03400 [Camellia lanceoleosa]